MKYSFFLKLPLFLIVSILLVSCNKETNTNTNADNNHGFDPIFEQGGIATYYDKIGLKETPILQKINHNEDYIVDFEIENLFTFDNKFKVFFFVNYKQTKIIINGKEHDFIDYGVIKSNESKGLQIDIPNLSEGRNEILVLTVRNPDKTLKKKEFVMGDFIHFTKRFIVVSGNEKQENNQKITHKLRAIKDTNNPIKFPYLTSDIDPTEITLESSTNPFKGKINFINNEKGSEYALIVLKNNKQISLDNSFFKVESTGRVEIPIDLNLDNKANNIIITVVPNPFTKPNIGEQELNDLTTESANKITMFKK